MAFRYRGVLHEFLEMPAGTSVGSTSGFCICSTREGARNQDPNKYHKDAQILERALQTEQDEFLRARYTFYLAQSYRDAGEKEKAVQNYLRRANLGYWIEEVYISHYCAAHLLEQSGRPFDEVITTYVRASDAVPTRAEALHAASRLCREKNQFAQGYEFARRALEIPQPASGLFVERWIYEYGLLDEFAVNAYWIGRYQECFDACQRLLREHKIPAEMRERISKNAEFAAEKLRTLATPTIAAAAVFKPKSPWIPQTPLAGTEIMIAGLRQRMGAELDRISLQVNYPGRDQADDRPQVVWMHHDVNQRWVQWCNDKRLVDTVACFVFVSYWQRERYLNAFGLPPERCFVLRHGLDLNPERRRWETGPILRCAYTSTPFRGLSVLLDAWERLSPGNAELHIWSSMRLYREDDGPYEHLYARAESLRGVTYHGLAPNTELRAALRSMHFFAYPCTFAETACLAAIEAMAAGCRLIVPSLGALPETTAGYARIYPSSDRAEADVAAFVENLSAELAAPWDGDPGLSLSQQAHCGAVYDWQRRLPEWRLLIHRVCNGGTRADRPQP
jgi:hypothetical protein